MQIWPILRRILKKPENLANLDKGLKKYEYLATYDKRTEKDLNCYTFVQNESIPLIYKSVYVLQLLRGLLTLGPDWHPPDGVDGRCFVVGLCAPDGLDGATG